MAAQNRKSILGHLDNDRDVAQQIANDKSVPSAGFQDPPPGITNGVALLDETKFEVYKSGENEGKVYFTGIGLIKKPTKHVFTPSSQGNAIPGASPEVITTEGMQTRIRIDCFDAAPKSGKNMGKITPVRDKLLEVGQHLRALGVDTSRIRVASDLEGLAEELTRVTRHPETPIYFKFSTSLRKAQKQGENDGVWQNWYGTQGCENFVPPDASSGTDDDSPAVDPDQDAIDNALGAGSDADSTPQVNDNDITTIDTDILLIAAKEESGNDTPAVDELLRRASEKTGKTVEEINGEVNSLEELVDLINADVAPVVEAPKEPEPPKKGEHFNYKPWSKVLGKMKQAAKDVQCSVTTVNAGKKTVTLKNTVDPKIEYKDVPWAELVDIG